MRNKTIKTGVGLEISMLNLIELNNPDNCRVATVTLRGRQTMYVVGKKLTVLINSLKGHFQSIIAVCSLLETSAHVHLLLVMKAEGPTAPELKKIFKKAKSKAKFGIIYDFKPIKTTPEQVAGYFRENYYQFMEARKQNRRNYKGKAIRMFNVPSNLRIDMNTFESWNPNLSNFRRTLTRFAEIYGTEVGDEVALTRRIHLPMREIRQAAYFLVNTTPGKPSRWPESLLRAALSMKRREYIEKLSEYTPQYTFSDEPRDDFALFV